MFVAYLVYFLTVVHTGNLVAFPVCVKHSHDTSLLLHFRSLEADSRLLGILNEQYDDRDVLISEISKQVRDKCQQLNVYSCVVLFSLISGGLCARPLYRQHFRFASALEVRSGNPEFNSLPYRSLDLFLGRPALFNSSATLVKSQLFCLRSNGILNSILFRGNFCLTPLPFSWHPQTRLIIIIIIIIMITNIYTG